MDILPDSAAKLLTPDELKGKTKNIDRDAVIINPYSGKEKLTRDEAIDLINHISGALVSDRCYKREQEYKVHI